MEVYFSVSRGQREGKSTQKKSELDPINKKLVGKLKLEELQAALKTSILKLRDSINNGMKMLDPSFTVSDIIESDEGEIAKAMLKKGITESIAHNNEDKRDTLEALTENSEFFTKAEEEEVHQAAPHHCFRGSEILGTDAVGSDSVGIETDVSMDIGEDSGTGI